VRDSVRGAAAVRDAVRDAGIDSVRDSVRGAAAVRDAVRDAVRSEKNDLPFEHYSTCGHTVPNQEI